MADRPVQNQEIINATNNLRMAVYQGLTNPPELGDPATNMNYEAKMRMEAYEKGPDPFKPDGRTEPPYTYTYNLPAGKRAAKIPDPPAPHISARDMDYLRHVNDSLLMRTIGNRVDMIHSETQ
jgi:hypothetical protein